MNLAIRKIEANLGQYAADTFHNDLHNDMKFDYILANPPFNISDWGGDRLREDKRWAYGPPPTGNANFAWVQHMISKLAPNGVAGFILANGSLSTNTSGEGEIRRKIIEADLVDCIVSLPGQLFYSTQIPVSLWFLARNKKNGRGEHGKPLKNRSGEILFIDARKLGRMEDRTHRTLDESDITAIANTYHAWRGDDGPYEDAPGFCKAASFDEVHDNSFVLTPGRYVGAETIEVSEDDFRATLSTLLAKLDGQFVESRRLEELIQESLLSVQNDK
jgi:type I restriction enzyme M protein